MAVRKWSCLIIALFVLSIFTTAALGANDDSKGGGALAPVQSFQVKFKLDTATTKGLMMGDVWVAPAQFTGAQTGRFFRVEARAVTVDVNGNDVELPAQWKSDTPSMVKVAPATGKQVKFTVMKPGQGTVQVSYGNLTISSGCCWK